MALVIAQIVVIPMHFNLEFATPPLLDHPLHCPPLLFWIKIGIKHV